MGKKKNLKEYVTQICSASGEVKKQNTFFSEIEAQNNFEKIVKTFEGIISEWDNAGTVGYIRLIADFGNYNYLRRELYIKA